MKKSLTVICLFALLLTVSIAYAEDEQIFDAPGGDNNPATNEDANACFRGGVLAGKCSSTDVDMDGDVDDFDRAWMWTAGWHLIRFNEGLIERENFPSYYMTILPALPEPEVPVVAVPAAPALPSAGCLNSIGSTHVDFGGGYFLPAGSTAWGAAGCSGITGTLGPAYVYAPAPFDALTLCNLNGTYTRTVARLNDIYVCRT